MRILTHRCTQKGTFFQNQGTLFLFSRKDWGDPTPPTPQQILLPVLQVEKKILYDTTNGQTKGQSSTTSGKTSTTSRETSTTVDKRASTMRDQTSFASTTSDKLVKLFTIKQNVALQEEL